MPIEVPRPAKAIAAVLVATSLLAVAGCGSSPPAPTILDTEKVERAIENSSVAQRGQRPRASCPAGVHQKRGLMFTCTAVLGPGSTRFTVTQLDGAGHVHYEAR
jgi:hypothetical protein